MKCPDCNGTGNDPKGYTHMLDSWCLACNGTGKVNEMKVIIAGGRNYMGTLEDITNLFRLHDKYKFGEIVSGGAKGADSFGELFAETARLPLKVFPADWKTYGQAAGFVRNKEMAMYADAVILFPGGKGTDSMRKLAIKYGLKILYDAEEEK